MLACKNSKPSSRRGIDAPSPQERPAARKLALEWLMNDHKACETKYNTDKAKLSSIVHAVMNRWLTEAMLADVRGTKIAKLPKEEQAAWEAVWIKVASLSP